MSSAWSPIVRVRSIPGAAFASTHSPRRCAGRRGAPPSAASGATRERGHDLLGICLARRDLRRRSAGSSSASAGSPRANELPRFLERRSRRARRVYRRSGSSPRSPRTSPMPVWADATPETTRDVDGTLVLWTSTLHIDGSTSIMIRRIRTIRAHLSYARPAWIPTSAAARTPRREDRDALRVRQSRPKLTAHRASDSARQLPRPARSCGGCRGRPRRAAPSAPVSSAITLSRERRDLLPRRERVRPVAHLRASSTRQRSCGRPSPARRCVDCAGGAGPAASGAVPTRPRTATLPLHRFAAIDPFVAVH